jgi:hypothetical protein
MRNESMYRVKLAQVLQDEVVQTRQNALMGGCSPVPWKSNTNETFDYYWQGWIAFSNVCTGFTAPKLNFDI